MKKQLALYGLYTLITGFILYFSFQIIFQFPGHYLFGNGGDGLKNYFTMTHYIKYDHGFHFSGMNYPYGENIFFTDNQPFYSLVLNWINTNIINIENDIVGIINLWMIFSIFLTGFFILKILKRFKLPDWYALIFAILITFLSPQLDRIGGHYALSYGWYIPGIWYFLLKIYDRKSSAFDYLGLIIIFIISATTHLYFLAINSMLIILFSLVSILISRHKQYQKFIKTFSITVFIALFVFFLLKYTDSITDRPVKPWGADYYISSFESVFLPNSGPVHNFLHVGNQQFEGLAYVGLTGLLFLAFFTVFLIAYIIKNRNDFSEKIINEINEKDSLLYTSIITATIILLFSSHFIHRLDFLGIINRIDILNQFRSLGRFAWVFYYIYTVFVSFFIYRHFSYFLNRKRYMLAYIPLFLVVIIWNDEAGRNLSNAIKPIFNKNELLSNKNRSFTNILDKNNTKIDEFQAILQFPIAVSGPELFDTKNGGWTLNKSMQCSNETGLPIIDFSMSRTSIKQGLELLGLTGKLPIIKSRLSKMNDKPFLLLCNFETMSNREKEIAKKAKYLGKVDFVDLFELPIDSLKTSPNKIYHHLDPISLKHDTVFLEGSKGYFYFNNFEYNNSPFSFNGKGAVYYENDTIVCKEIPKDSLKYEISLWVYLDPKSEKPPVIFNDYSDGNNSSTQYTTIGNSTDTKDYWVNFKFIVDSGLKHCLRIDGKAYIDAILIKPEGSHLIQIMNRNIYYDCCSVHNLK